MPAGVGYGPQNTASVGKDIHVIGEHAYAYSGFIAAVNTSTTYLNFTTGNYYFVGQFQFNTPLEEDNPTAGIEATCRVNFNSLGVAMLKASSDFNDNADGSVIQNIIIPPFTVVQVLVDCHTTDATRFGTCSFTGKLYRKTD